MLKRLPLLLMLLGCNPQNPNQPTVPNENNQDQQVTIIIGASPSPSNGTCPKNPDKVSITPLPAFTHGTQTDKLSFSASLAGNPISTTCESGFDITWTVNSGPCSVNNVHNVSPDLNANSSGTCEILLDVVGAVEDSANVTVN